MTDVTPEIEAVAAALDDAFTKAELEAYADEFGVELKSSFNKRAVTLAFAEAVVSAELIKGLKGTDEEAVEEDAPVVEAVAPVAEPVDESDRVLIRMTRTNHSYEVRGYRFTRDNPFGLVTEDDADYLIETEGGFAMASPKEARAYYS